MSIRKIANSFIRQRLEFCGLMFVACAAVWSGTASATLLDRGPDLVYDDVLDITWARNANLAGDGFMTWSEAQTWVDSLTLDGFSDWRLPTISKSGLTYPLAATLLNGGRSVGIGCSTSDLASCRDDELAYMYFFNLFPCTTGQDCTGDKTSYLGAQQIENIQQGYWSGTQYPGTTAPSAWAVTFGGGFSSSTTCGPGCGGGWYENQPQNFLFAAWAVRDGDVQGGSVTSVPEPSTLALLGLGLVAGAAVARRRRAGEQPTVA